MGKARIDKSNWKHDWPTGQPKGLNPGPVPQPPKEQPKASEPPKKQEPVRVASAQTGGGLLLGSALVLVMKHVFKTDLSIDDALIIVGAVTLVANILSGEVARLRVTAPEK